VAKLQETAAELLLLPGHGTRFRKDMTWPDGTT